MPIDFSKYGIQTTKPAASNEIDFSKYGIKTSQTAGLGSSWENPLQEQGVSSFERHAVQMLSPNPEKAIEWLQREPGKGGKPRSSQESHITFGLDTGEPDVFQYEAKIYKPSDWKHTNYIAVRKKGTNDPWKVVAPEALSNIKDLPTKIAENAPELAIIGSPVAKGVGALTAGAKFGGQVGLLEAGRRGLGKYLYGFEDTPEEIVQSGLKEAVIGGVLGAGGAALGSVAKKVIPKGIETAGKALQLPSKAWQKVTGVDKELALKAAQKTALEQKILAKEGGEKLVEEQLSKGGQIADELIARAPKEAPVINKMKAPGTFIEAADIPGTKIYGSAKARVEVAADAIDPIFGLKAATLDGFPWIKGVLRKWYGPQVASEAGSKSMAWRDRYLPRWASKYSQEEVNQSVRGYESDMARGMLADPKFNKLISEESRSSIAKVAKGTATASEKRIFQESLKGALEKANLDVMKARLAKMGAGGLSGHARELETALGAIIGGGTFGPAGAGVGGALGYLRGIRGTMALSGMAGKGLENLGRWLGNPAELSIAARSAPPGVRSLLETPLKVLRARGLNAYKVALTAALQNPVVQQWLSGQEQNLQNKP
jgi:hypothetical protein